MTAEEIVQLVEVIAGLWPNAPRYGVHHLRGFQLLLKDIQVDVAETALASLAAEGSEFPPVAGQIYRRAMDLTDPTPDWGAAWQEVMSWVRAHGWVDPPNADSFSHPSIYVACMRIGYQELCQSNVSEAGVWQGHFRRIFEASATDVGMAHDRARLASLDMENPFALDRGTDDA